MSFEPLGLTPELLAAVADQGYTVPTPVQEQAIPLVLAGRDVLAGAQTGTGKTAAFVLPILQHLHATRVNPLPTPALSGRPVRDPRPRPRAAVRVLVLTPTRELALQVEESVRVYGARRRVRSTPIYGGVGFEPQARALRAGAEFVVATPGRLLDHVGQRTIDLSAVEILVLDEADRMLDMGFIRDIRSIIALLPPVRQTLMFSATFSDEIRGLASGILRDPAMVQVAPRNAITDHVRQVVIPVDRDRKRELLSELIRSGRIDQALVFARTKHGANRLAEQLVRDGISAAAIHGNRSQAQRVRALADFKNRAVAILVATDIAARGIDIDALPHVVNFELPMVAEDYIHRIGRTARAGAEGDAISLVCIDEAPLLRDIERVLRRPLPTEVVAGFEPDRSIRPEPIRLRSGIEERRVGVGRAGTGDRRPFGPRGNVPVPADRRHAPARQDVGRPQHVAPRAAGPGHVGPRAAQQHEGRWAGADDRRPAAGRTADERRPATRPEAGRPQRWESGWRSNAHRNDRPAQGSRSQGASIGNGQPRAWVRPPAVLPIPLPGERLGRLARETGRE